MQLIGVGKHEDEIIGQVDASGGASRVNGAQDVEGHSPAFSLSKLGGAEHALLDSHGSFAAVVRVLKLRMLEVERELVEVVNNVHCRAMKLSPFWPDIWSDAPGIGRHSSDVAGNGELAAIFHGQPDKTTVAGAQFQHVFAGSAPLIDFRFDFAQCQKATEHEVAQALVIIAVAPEGTPSMGSAASKQKPRLCLNLRRGQIRTGQITLEDHRTTFGISRFQYLGEQVSHTTEMSSEKANRAPGVLIGFTFDEADIECFFLSLPIGPHVIPDELVVDFFADRIILLALWHKHLRAGVVAGEKLDIRELVRECQVDSDQIQSHVLKHAADLTRGELGLPYHAHHAVNRYRKAHVHLDEVTHSAPGEAESLRPLIKHRCPDAFAGFRVRHRLDLIGDFGDHALEVEPLRIVIGNVKSLAFIEFLHALHLLSLIVLATLGDRRRKQDFARSFKVQFRLGRWVPSCQLIEPSIVLTRLSNELVALVTNLLVLRSQR